MLEDEARHGGIRVAWSPSARVARFEYDTDAAFTGEAADAILPVFRAWVGPGDAPYGILVDATRVGAPRGEWRMKWAAYHHEEPGRARIATYGANLFVRMVLEGHGRITRTPLRCFADEAAARAWLRSEVGPSDVTSGTPRGARRTSP